LPLFFRPGFLTKEYFAGRRVHYVPPLRLYLFVSIVFFISLKFIISTYDTKTINVNNNITAVTQIPEVTKYLKDLESKKSQLVINNETEKAGLVTEDITKFTHYLNELKEANSPSNNAKLIKMTSKIVALEFEQIESNEPLSERDRVKYEKLLAKRLLLLQEKKNEGGSGISISNNSDGTLSFDFLSDENNQKLDTFAKEIAKKAKKAFETDTGPLIGQVLGKLPQLMFILLPVFAVLLKIMFIFSKRLYMEHLTVALHSHAFIFISLLLSEVLDLGNEYFEPNYSAVAEALSYLGSALLIWIPIYLFIMQKRVYQQGYILTFIKYSIIANLYFILIMITAFTAAVWGLTAI